MKRAQCAPRLILVVCGLWFAAGNQVKAAVILDQLFDPDSISSIVNAGFGSINPNQQRGQTFTVGVTGTLAQIDVFIRRQVGNTGDLRFELRKVGSDGTPLSGAGGLLAQTSVPALSVPTFPNPVAFFPFDLTPWNIPVTVGEQLAVVLFGSAGNITYQWIGGTANPYPFGAAREAIAGNWFHDNNPDFVYDLGFRTFVDVPEPSLTLALAIGVLGLPRRRRGLWRFEDSGTRSLRVNTTRR